MKKTDNIDVHRHWLFANKDGKEIKFSQRTMPFAVFKPNAKWGGVCIIGDVKCRIRILHNQEGEKGKRLEVWFPDRELGREVPLEGTTIVGHIEIRGNWREKTGRCIFRAYRKDEANGNR